MSGNFEIRGQDMYMSSDICLLAMNKAAAILVDSKENP